MSESNITLFHEQLLRYAQEHDDSQRKEIEQLLWDKFGETITVLIVDLSGFTKLTERYGVVHYLSMVRRMQLTATPIITNYNGEIVKFEADNVFARFASPGNAVRAAISLNMAFDSANLLTPEVLDVHISCGIAHGGCLIPKHNDFFGAAVNAASKLGEDLGTAGSILITEEAAALIPKSLEIDTELSNTKIPGSDAKVFSVIYRR